MDQTELQRAIEAAFARADRQNLRQVTKELDQLLRRLEDLALRAQYYGALDVLPEMVKRADDRE